MHIYFKGTITTPNTSANGAAVNNTNEKVISKNCALFTDWIAKIINTQVANGKDIDVVMSMFNLIGYSNNYLKTSESLRQYFRAEPSLNANHVITEFNGANYAKSFKSKAKNTGQTGANCTKDVQIMVPLKYISNLSRILEMPLINLEVNLVLTWFVNCVLVSINNVN